MELKDKTALITGASGQLGSAIARAFAREGCHCICHYHTKKDRADQLVQEIANSGSRAIAVQADLTDAEQIPKLFAEPEPFAPVQILINCAAAFQRVPLGELDAQQIRQTLDLNLTAAILTCKHFAAVLDKGIEGRIINLADVGGIKPWAEYSAYCASKAALIAATKALAKELASAITVNAIAPGIVDSPDIDPAERKRQLEMIPVRRFAQPCEITRAALFLLHNPYITGQVLQIDGGRCI